MTLENIKAECERDTARVDALHEKMDRLSKADTQDKTATTQDAPGQPMPYVPQQRGPRPAIHITALVAVLAIVLIAVLVYIVVSQDESPTGVYEEYVDALKTRTQDECSIRRWRAESGARLQGQETGSFIY